MLNADCVRPTCWDATLIEPDRATTAKFLRTERSRVMAIDLFDIGVKLYQFACKENTA